MKPEEYAEKFKFRQGKIPESFWKQFRNDFKSELLQTTPDIKGFNHAVSVMKLKWETIRFKTASRCISPGAWSYFYADTVVPVKEHLFPEHKRKRRKKESAGVERTEYPRPVTVNTLPDRFGTTWEDIILEVLKFIILKRRTR